MATGYTQPVVDGKITEFNDFAKKCIRAFGVADHMRDMDASLEYEKRIPDENNYRKNSISNSKNLLLELEKMSDSELVEDEKKDISKKVF
jgi:hypothetical protein